MDVSGTLHFYSGDARELFFAFDDDVAQRLYGKSGFDIDDVDSRRVFISVGSDRFIHRRTLNFSRKQTEIKVSLCSKGSKDGLGALTALYDWFGARGGPRPPPFGVLGSLERSRHGGADVWELHIIEPIDLVVPPGLPRRTKKPAAVRRSFEHRRLIIERDLSRVGRRAEELALLLAQDDYQLPEFRCLWRDRFLDSERVEIRRMGVIADIDVWNVRDNSPAAFIEVKAQKVPANGAQPIFFLSPSEWRSHQRAVRDRLPYQIWLFQYRDPSDFLDSPDKIRLVVFDSVEDSWLQPDGYVVTPQLSSGVRYSLHC